MAPAPPPPGGRVNDGTVPPVGGGLTTNMDYSVYLRFFLALAFVVALIALVAWLGRRFGFLGAMRTAGQRARGRRLGIVESAPLDAKRRLVLVRCDDREHLVLLGPNSELLVESGIAPPASPPVTRPPGPETAP